MSAVGYTMVTSSAMVKTTPGLLVGAVLTAGDAAYVTLRDGGATGAVIVSLRLAAAGTVDLAPTYPLPFSTSLYCKVESGTVEVTVAYI